jgi:hypothetical protein
LSVTGTSGSSRKEEVNEVLGEMCSVVKGIVMIWEEVKKERKEDIRRSLRKDINNRLILNNIIL